MANDHSGRAGRSGRDASGKQLSEPSERRRQSFPQIPLSAYPLDKLLTTDQVAALWEVTAGTLYTWRTQGVGPHFVELSPGGVVTTRGRHGGRGPTVRYQVEHLRLFLARNHITTDGTIPNTGRPTGGTKPAKAEAHAARVRAKRPSVRRQAKPRS